MSRREYQDDCVGCQPAMVDLKTKKVYPVESPEMQAILTVFGAAKRAEKVAFHNVTCNNSRESADLMLFDALCRRMQKALRSV